LLQLSAAGEKFFSEDRGAGFFFVKKLQGRAAGKIFFSRLSKKLKTECSRTASRLQPDFSQTADKLQPGCSLVGPGSTR